jgi:hypothetical protein
MKCSYQEITDVMGPPLWWDESGVPRYVQFSPHVSANIHAQEIVLAEIACQSCFKLFKVCMSIDSYQQNEHQTYLRDHLIEHGFNYGDPPFSRCCETGCLMSSIPVRIIEFWQRNAERQEKRLIWERDPIIENLDIRADWAEEENLYQMISITNKSLEESNQKEVTITAAKLNIDLNQLNDQK